MRLEVIEPDQLTAGVLLQFEKKRKSLSQTRALFGLSE
jgi:hypothetical protein